MGDTTHEAPERIWLINFVKDGYGARLGRGTISDLDHSPNPDYPEYVRADRIEELEGQLKATLDRETASQKRHDEKVDALEAKLPVAVEGFEELARLGNGDRHGNSFGNLLAQNYIAELKGGKDE